MLSNWSYIDCYETYVHWGKPAAWRVKHPLAHGRETQAPSNQEEAGMEDVFLYYGRPFL
jgi:hypothetical protein